MDLSELLTPLAAFSVHSNSESAQEYAVPRLDGNQNKARMYTAGDWNDQKSEISRLYESNTLESIIKFMREQHGLKATSKQYKDRIKKWGLSKNIQPNEMDAMIRKQRERAVKSNKSSAFRIRGRPVNPGRITRYIREHAKQSISANNHENMDQNMGSARIISATPGAISCYTPSDTGPLTPPEALNPQESSNQAAPAKPQPLLPLHPNGSPQPPPQQSVGYDDVLPIVVQDNPEKTPTVCLNSYVSGNNNTPQPLLQSMHHFIRASEGYEFQISNLTGRRKALLIGINYYGQRGQLRGCINDVRNMSGFLNDCYGYRRDDMVILTDDQQHSLSQPTKQNMLRAMHWLVKDAKPNDSLFFHYSGHGGQTKDLDGDGEDGYDEVIYPVDFRQVGHIVDDDMHDIMVKPLLPGVRLTAIFDSCHSSTALDLPYMYSTQGILKEPNLAKEAGQGLLGVISNYSQGNYIGVVNIFNEFIEKATTDEDASNRTIATRKLPADVIMWSGSKDDQTSAGKDIATKATGAMSWAFITALKKNPGQSYFQLLNSIRDELATKYTQKPQLSCSHPLNSSLLFTM